MRFRFDPWEWHHLYTGIILSVIAFLLNDGKGAGLILTVGLWLILDDLYQHWRQAYDPDYKSPVRLMFNWIWNKIFGRWWPFGDL